MNGEHYLTEVYDKGAGWNDVGVEARLGYILEIPKVDLESGLIAYYPFNGNANDESGNGNDGTITGATLVEDRFGNSDAAYRIDDKGDVIDTPDFTSNEITVSLWYDHHETLGYWNTLLGHDEGGYHHLLINPDNEEIGFYSYSIWNSSGYKIIANTNYYITLTKSGSNSKIYIDGLLVFSHDNSFENNTYPLSRIGNNGGSGRGQGALGVIDDVRIYDRALSEVEVAALYELESIPPFDPEEGLVAYYPFNGNANDESGNGNDGEAIIGATLAEDRFGIENKAYYFDGKSYIETSSGSNLPTDGNFTISLWFNFDSPYSNGQGSLLSNQMTDQFQIAFDTWTAENPKLQFYTGGGAPVVNATELQWEDGKWYNIILVRHGDLFKLYRGGIEVYSSTSGKFNGANPEDRKITIGVASRNNLNHPWKGKIDDIRIYDRALSQDEVSALYELEDSKDLTDPPVDPVDPGEPQLATGSATVVNGFTVDLTVDFGGKGYTNPPEVRIVGGGGSGATAKAVVTDGIVIDLIVLTPGIGYSSTPSVEIDMPPFPPKQASATVQVVNGFVVGFEVTDSGRGYIEPPQISILSNTGSGAQAEAILSEGKLAEIKVLNPGIGYSDDATVEVGPPSYPPVRAAGQAEVINGFLVGLEVTDGGRGYGFAPRLKITGGGGSGATAVALVEDGKVVGLNITAAGSGYSSAPEIIIAPPKPEVMIVRGEEGVKVKASSNPGLRCRLEGSRDLITWSKVGNDVVSKSYEVDFKLDATETMHFFRVIWLD